MVNIWPFPENVLSAAVGSSAPIKLIRLVSWGRWRASSSTTWPCELRAWNCKWVVVVPHFQPIHHVQRRAMTSTTTTTTTAAHGLTFNNGWNNWMPEMHAIHNRNDTMNGWKSFEVFGLSNLLFLIINILHPPIPQPPTTVPLPALCCPHFFTPTPPHHNQLTYYLFVCSSSSSSLSSTHPPLFMLLSHYYTPPAVVDIIIIIAAFYFICSIHLPDTTLAPADRDHFMFSYSPLYTHVYVLAVLVVWIEYSD